MTDDSRTTQPAPAPPLEPADRVVAAVVGTQGVARMHPGMFGEVATYLPGRKVVGVRISAELTHVDVVLDWGVSVPQTADQVRRVVEPLVGTPVHVTVQDLAEPTPSARG